MQFKPIKYIKKYYNNFKLFNIPKLYISENITTQFDPLINYRQYIVDKDIKNLTKVFVDLRKNDKFDLSIKLFEEMKNENLEISPKIAAITLFDYRHLGKYSDAVEFFKSLVDKGPFPNPLVCIEYLRNVLNMKDDKLLEESLAIIFKHYSDSPILNEFYCSLLFSRNDHDKIYQYFLYLKKNSIHLSSRILDTMLISATLSSKTDRIQVIWSYHQSYQGFVDNKGFSIYISYLRHTNQLYECLYYIHDSLQYNPRNISCSILPPLLAVSHSVCDYSLLKKCCDNLYNYVMNNNNKVQNKFKIYFIIAADYAYSMCNDIEKCKTLLSISLNMLSFFNSYGMLLYTASVIGENELYQTIDKIISNDGIDSKGLDFLMFFDTCYGKHEYNIICTTYNHMKNNHSGYKFSAISHAYIALSFYHMGIEDDIITDFLNRSDINSYFSSSIANAILCHALNKTEQCMNSLQQCSISQFPNHSHDNLIPELINAYYDLHQTEILNTFILNYFKSNIYHNSKILNKIEDCYKTNFTKPPEKIMTKLKELQNYAKKCDSLNNTIKKEN